MPDLGNILDSIFKPEWLSVVHSVEALATNAEGEVKTALQNAQSEVTTALNNAATAVSSAQGQIATTVNPIVNNAIETFGASVSAAYPPFAPLIASAEGDAEKLADAGTDAILSAAITKLAGLLSAAGKATAAVNLSNLAGAS